MLVKKEKAHDMDVNSVQWNMKVICFYLQLDFWLLVMMYFLHSNEYTLCPLGLLQLLTVHFVV